jgi:hypothetical protein
MTERIVKLLTEYLERAVQLEGMAAAEPDSNFKNQLIAQAQSYRKLAEKRAAEYGLPPPSPPTSSSETTT